MEGMSELLYQGHASFRLCSPAGVVLFIDPYAGEGYELAADAVFCSHDHADHCATERATCKPSARIWRQAQMHSDGDYRTAQVGDVSVRAVPAYNEKHPREAGVGFLVETGGRRLYFAGDTSWIPEMADLAAADIFYAFFPTDGFYNMDAAEASRCASFVNAVHSIPIHTCRNTEGIFSEENARRFTAPGRLILRPGDRLTW